MIHKTNIYFLLAIIGILLLIQIDYSLWEIMKFHLEQRREIQEAREIQHKITINNQIPYKGYDDTRGFGVKTFDEIERGLDKVAKQFYGEKAQWKPNHH